VKVPKVGDLIRVNPRYSHLHYDYEGGLNYYTFVKEDAPFCIVTNITEKNDVIFYCPWNGESLRVIADHTGSHENDWCEIINSV
tara:strand:- start:6473 stop:6724 length:252 start_codon:yes stop_codon:yes gene_type:complete